MSGTTWPWPPKSRWAWNIVPFYNQAVEDGATDTFFSALFSRWFDRFPIRPEEFESGRLFGRAVEDEKEVFFPIEFCQYHNSSRRELRI
jgi:hypothetical protein